MLFDNFQSDHVLDIRALVVGLRNEQADRAAHSFGKRMAADAVNEDAVFDRHGEGDTRKEPFVGRMKDDIAFINP